MPYYQLYYHLIWTTKKREPLLTSEVEPIIYGYLRQKAQHLGGTVYALNGVEDHVHMIVSIPPKVAVATFIGQVKGVASTKFNKQHQPERPFRWQKEYGALSFGRKQLANFVSYVERQKVHHAQNTLINALETIS